MLAGGCELRELGEFVEAEASVSFKKKKKKLVGRLRSTMLMCSCEKVDFNITPRTVARLVFEAEQDHRSGGNSSNGR